MPDPTAILQQFALANSLAFNDPALLRTALTHRSYLNEHADLDWEDNERLEYLGDAVLDFVLAEYLYRGFPAAPEGELTALRAALVRRETLARLAQRLDIGPALFMGHGEVETGGRERAATLCGAFEAVVGALYLDQGLQSVTEWVHAVDGKSSWPARTPRSPTRIPRAACRSWRKANWGSPRATGP